MKNRLKVVPAVYIAILKEGQVLLQRRFQTGYMDGYYDLPSGHVERGETLKESCIRELAEETGLKTAKKDLNLIHIYQNFANPDKPYFGYIFLARVWQGEPTIQEPGKCDDMGFFSLDNLPAKLVPQVGLGLSNVDAKKRVTFSLLGREHKVEQID